MKKTRLPPLTAIRVFDAVARHASFKCAAEEMNVTATAVSHQMRVLEEALGCRLFERSAKAVTMTTQGRRLYQASQVLFTTLSEAVDDIVGAHQPGAITLSSTANFLTHWLVPRLAQLNIRHPQLELRLHSGIALVDVKGAQADCAVRYSEQVDEGLDNTLLYQDRFVLVCHPSLNLQNVYDLTTCPLLHVENRRVPEPAPDWAHWQSVYGPENLDITTGVWFDDEMHAIQAAIAGHGVLIASELLVSDALAKGLLCMPLAGALPGGNYYFVTSREKARQYAVKTVKAWLVAAFCPPAVTG